MKKIFIVFVSILMAQSVSSQSFMYEVSGGKFKKKSYLFGTIHMQQESLFNWNNKVYDAIDQCDVAAFEINLQNGVDFKKIVNPKMQEEWIDFLTNDFLPELERTVPADTLTSKIIRFYKPLMESLMGASSQEPKRIDFVDAYLQNYAVKKGKKIFGIETFAEQVNMINSIDKKRLQESLLKFIKSDDWTNGMSSMMLSQSSMIELYRNKDFDGLCNMLTESMNTADYEMFSEFYRQMFEVRNQIMYDRILKSMKKKSVFMAVGSGHLCGSTGLIETFRKAGYTVTPIDIKTPTPSKQIVWKTYSHPEFSVDIPSDVDSIFDESEDSWLKEFSTSLVNTTFTTSGKAKFYITRMYDMQEESMDFIYGEDTTTSEQEMFDSMYHGEAPIDEADVVEEQVVHDGEWSPTDTVVQTKSYMEQIKEGLKSELFVAMITSMKDLKMQSTTDTLYVGEGEHSKMIIKTSSFGSNELNYTIQPTIVDDMDKYGWNLQVKGDPSILESQEILRFFTSFQAKP